MLLDATSDGNTLSCHAARGGMQVGAFLDAKLLLGMLRFEMHLHRLRVRSRLHADMALVLGMPDRTTRSVLLPLRTASTIHGGILLLLRQLFGCVLGGFVK